MDLISKTLALRQSYEFRVLTLQHKGTLSSLLENAGIEVVPLGMKGRWDVGRLAELSRWMKSWQVDLIHAHMQNAFWAASLVRLAHSGLPFVYTIQKEAQQVGTFERLLGKVLMPRATAITTPSTNVRRGYGALGLDGDNVHVVYNSIDLERLRGGDGALLRELGIASGPLIGAIGRLLAVKGHEHLIRALPAIVRATPSVQCVLIGDGPEGPGLRALAQHLGVGGSIKWLGARTDIQNFLPFFDVFVMPSNSEAFGIAAAEALACGVPVVATSVGGLLEVVQDGRNGYLVPPADADAIAARVSSLLADAETRASFGRNARESAARFSASAVAQEWTKIYAAAGARPREEHPS